MHVSPTSYATAFNELRQIASHTVCRLVVFVASLDVDAVCGCKIFTRMLKREMVPHRVSPVTGYSDLKAQFGELDADVTAVVLFGCGALVDLSAYLYGDEEEEEEGEEEERRRIYVFDSHRPWNLQNLFGTSEVVCFDDGDVDDGLLDREQAAFTALLEQEEEEEEEGDDDSHTDKESDNSDIENEIDDLTTDSSESKRKHARDSPRPRKQVRTARKEHENVLAAYYSRGTTYSTPVASQAYTLLSFLGDTSVADLWFSIVGTTALDRHAPQLYRRLFPLLADEVGRLGPRDGVKLSADDRTLVIVPDYRIFLLRHWSLYDGLMHSSYVSAKLKLWTEEGRKRLHVMLAMMGVSLAVARERWTHADVAFKRELKDRLELVADKFDVGHVVRAGVVRKFGFRGAVSAGDAVESIAALLEAGRARTVVDEASANFWCGWDGLDDPELLMYGLGRAKMVQEAVVRTASRMLEKRSVKQTRTFDFAVVKDGPDLELFTVPTTLARLARYVSECRGDRTGRRHALIVAAYMKATDTYMVVGLQGQVQDDEGENDDLVPNSFGIAFQQIAQEMRARVRIDSFESSVVEVNGADLGAFLEGMMMIDIR